MAKHFILSGSEHRFDVGLHRFQPALRKPFTSEPLPSTAPRNSAWRFSGFGATDRVLNARRLDAAACRT
jgi:hypothetical protein